MELSDFFSVNQEVAIAFSGGADSAYLLYAASKWARRVKAYYVSSAFQPEFEMRDAMRLASELQADIEVIRLDILSDSAVTSNPPDRCYHCKRKIFTSIMEHAAGDGFSVILDGTNASDDASDRPGMRALSELRVLSPLRLCGLTKSEIRRLSKEAGLFTHDKCAYACLATRIPTGTVITGENLSATERAEDFLFSLGFSDFRVRMTQTGAKLQVREEQLLKVIEHRAEIVKELSEYYDTVLLDLEVRK